MLYKKITLMIAVMITIGLTDTTTQASDTLIEQTKHQETTMPDIVNFSEFSLVLKPSSLGGIGVFAAHDIPAGTLLFNRTHEMRTLKIKDVPQEFIKYCIFTSDEECIGPERFDRMEIGWYINHSATPNIEYNFKICKLYALTDIKAGDEILIDYNYLGEPEHLKESFYQHPSFFNSHSEENMKTSIKNAPAIDRNDPDIIQRIIAENDLTFAFLGNMPIVPGHTLICPKRVVALSQDLTTEEWTDLLNLKNEICERLKKVLGAEGFNYAWNEGAVAGQSVPYFHLHVVPRKQGDTGITQYEPRDFLYRTGSRATTPREELMVLAQLLRVS